MKAYKSFQLPQQGVSIVELMVAIAIGLLVTAAIASLYVSNKQSFNLQDEMSRLQENARLVTDAISNDARYAGYLGCSSLPSATKLQVLNSLNVGLTTPKQKLYQFEQGIDGLNNISTGGLGAFSDLFVAGSVLPKANTDLLALYGATGGSATVLQTKAVSPTAPLVSPNASSLKVTKSSGEANACPSGTGTLYNGFLCSADVVVASDCQSAVVFQATTIVDSGTGLLLLHDATGTPGNKTLPGSSNPADWDISTANQVFLVEEGAEINKLAAHIYYVGTDNNLYLMDSSVNGAAPVKLVDNVEDLQVWYGVHTGSAFESNCFLTANQMTSTGSSSCSAGNWQDVVGLRLSFVIRSAKTNLFPAKASTFSVAGQTITDGALRREIKIEVALRNRLQ